MLERFWVVGALLVGALTATGFNLAFRSPRVEGTVVPLEWTDTPVPADAALLHEESGLRFFRARRETFVVSRRGTLQLDAVDWSVVRHHQGWWWAMGPRLDAGPQSTLLFVVSDDDGVTFRSIRLPEPNHRLLLETEVAGERFVATFEGATLGPPWVWSERLPERSPARFRLVTKNAGRSWRLEL